MTILESAAKWVRDLKYEDVSDRARLAARYQVLNMVAAAHSAAGLEETRAVESGLLALGGKGGKATILASGAKTSPTHAAAINAAYSMAQDFDDIIWMGHTCHSAVFASLAVAEHEAKDSRAFLTAVVAANEIAGRLGASSFLGPLNGQMMTFIHLLGAAAATAKLLDLTEEQTAHALAIALSQPNFALQPAFMKPSSKLLSASTPIQTGIEAAYLAREGVTGATGILEDERGFWRRFAYVPLAEMWSDLGSFWAIETLTIKSFPGCHYFQTACSALQEVMARRPDLGSEQIAKIRVDTTKLALEVSKFGAEYGEGEVTHVNMNFDLATTLAVLLCAGRLTSREANSSWLAENSDQIRRVRSKIEVRHDPRLTAQVLASGGRIPAGRSGLKALTPKNLIVLRRRYSAEYRSDLLSLPELVTWVELGLERVVASFKPRPEAASGDELVSLRFPSRVTVTAADGRRETAQVDLPTGALACPEVESVLREKYLRETRGSLGAAQAENGFRLGLRLEEHALADFVQSQVGSSVLLPT